MSLTGKIKYWREEKGYGFIQQDGASPNDEGMFFHASALTGDRTLIETGDRVSYDVETDRKTFRPKAVNVTLVLSESKRKLGGGKYSHGF